MKTFRMEDIDMTDYETMKAMLDRAKIEYRLDTHFREKYDAKGRVMSGTPITILVVERGYAGFATVFEFSGVTGKLLDMGAYE